MRTLQKLFCFIFSVSIVEGALIGETLLVAHNHNLLLVDLSNGTRQAVLSADQHVRAFDLHRRWKQLFWATENSIYRTPLYDMTTRTPLAVVGQVGSLAVDWVHHHLYWTDVATGEARVEAAHLDGRRRRVVYHPAIGTNMGAMVLDPLKGKLFWIESDDRDNKTRIMTCNLDGTAVRPFYSSESVPRASPLVIDVTYSSVYFYKDPGNGSELWSMNYELLGGGTRLFERPGGPATSLCLAKNGFYFSNRNGTYFVKWVKRKIDLVYGNRTDQVTSLNPHFSRVDSKLANSSQIRLVSEVTQPEWPDQCAYHQCEHECVVTSHQDQQDHQRCVCRFGYELRADGRTCEERGYLIYSSGTTFGRITTKEGDNTLLFNDTSSNIQSFDVDVASEYIYWSDLFAQSIYRAPIEQLARREEVVTGVTAFGLAVDWIHNLIYWTDHSRVLLVSSSPHVTAPLVVVQNLDSPGNMAVDPIDNYIFWVECGDSLAIKRAGSDGSDVTVLINSHVTCGMSLTADQITHTLFILDWAGSVSLCRYDGSGRTKLRSDVVRAVAIVDHQPLWSVMEYSSDVIEHVDVLFREQLKVLAHDVQPAMIQVVKSSHQPGGGDECDSRECEGVCLRGKEPGVMCVCSGENNKMTHCPRKTNSSTGRSPNDYLEVVEITPFSVKLRCSGPLLKHNKMRPWVRVDEIDSLVSRESALRKSDYVHVNDHHTPFDVDNLNPATSYRFTVQHGVTRGSTFLEVHTPPPPLTLKRLSVVTVPGISGTVPWDRQGVHYTGDNPWEHLVSRKYFLLLLSNTTYTQMDPLDVPQDILKVLRRQVKQSFIVLNKYISEEDFDDDPEMYLANLPWGETFKVAMVQATEYRGSYNLDMVYSREFALPDPYWRSFVDDVLEEQDIVDSVERM